MKKFKYTAILLCAGLMLTSAVGCKKDKTTTSDTSNSISENNNNNNTNNNNTNTTKREIGKNEIVAGISEETDENDTVFKLNSVYITPDAQSTTEGERKYVYLDVEIKNNSDISYNLNCLNNFILVLPDGAVSDDKNGDGVIDIKDCEVYSHIQTNMYASNNFKENIYTPDPFNIPANGTFKGIVGGFRVPPETDSFTIKFFPTKDDPNNKESVIKIDVTADNIQPIPSDFLK